MKTPHIVLMAGGTGGHIFPALAVAQWLSVRGWQATWLGSKGGMEESLVAQHQIPLETISVAGVRGKSILNRLLSPLMLFKAVLESIRVLRRLKPDVVLGMGGFVSGPGGLASWLLGCPLCIHEQNAIAGMTNRYLARLAKYRLSAFPDALVKEDLVVGNPVREDIMTIQSPAERYSERQGALRILVVGGSRGAAILNETLPATITQLLQRDIDVKVQHQAGSGRRGVVLERYSECLAKLAVDMTDHIEVSDFITDMKMAYEWADLVVCRAGALTVSELAAAGVASVLIPFPHAVDDHQTANGNYLVRANAAVMLQQTAMTAQSLADLISGLGGREGCMALAINARKVAKTEATRLVAEHCAKAAHVTLVESV